MLQKHRQVLILLVGLLYIYSVCPFICAVSEQKFCHDAPQNVMSGATETQSTCCQKSKTGAAGETETPSESGKLCCETNLELVLPDDRHNMSEFRESIGQSLVSILPISVTLFIAPRESFQILPGPLSTTFFPDHSISRRGPPNLLHKEPFSF